MNRSFWIWTAILAAAVVVRLATLGAYPLADTTEARYGEIGRLMLSSGDWITPQIDAGVAFWGKPPLSFWLSALSFKLFGINEFAARLPSFLLLLATAGLIIRFGLVVSSPTAGIAAGAIMLTSAIGFISAGAVMTDPSLLLSTTLVMVGFWRAVVGQQRRWGLLMFAGLGLGLLAKGPVAWVLALTPIFIWLASRGDLLVAKRALPWTLGIVIVAGLSVPWYVAAELRTPGFLEYFLIGEHWMRFVDSGWQGDLYGTAHDEPRGTIWAFWLASAFPWSIIALALLAWNWRKSTHLSQLDSRSLYLSLWAVTPMLFFTFSGNVLATYVLPGLPALALLLSDAFERRRSTLIHAGWAIPAVFAVLGPMAIFDQVSDNSQKAVIDRVAANADCANLAYFPKRPYSAEFYSGGNAQLVQTENDVLQLLANRGQTCLAVRNFAIADLSPGLSTRLQEIRRYKKHTLFVEQAPSVSLTRGPE